MVIPRMAAQRRVAAVTGVLVAAALVSSACTKSSSSDKAGGGSGTGGAQEVVSSAAGTPGDDCNYSKYGAPKLDLKSTTVGFSQSEATSNPFRDTESKSITAEAKRLGIKLIQRNANGNISQQNTDIEDMIAQGAKALIVAPENAGVAPSLRQAKAKHIPVITIDRTVNGTACSDFVNFIGSNFLGQAKIAADDLGAALKGKGNVAELQGTSGNNVAADRTNGFNQELKAKYPNIKIVASQTANFDQATGQKVMAQMLQSHSDITGVYAQNDTMALGAIQAIRAAGKKPGTDIQIVGIDGIEDAVKNVASGVMYSDVETNPRFGPLAFQALQDFYSDKGTPTKVIIKDHHFTKANAADALKNGDVY
ncbi:MAG TPA: ABC transporter substrate-binding protein [Jatrophihabitans sp.]|nr:ABC transporter substrate-binding protein [Jatrophihabitans sp.]